MGNDHFCPWLVLLFQLVDATSHPDFCSFWLVFIQKTLISPQHINSLYLVILTLSACSPTSRTNSLCWEFFGWRQIDSKQLWTWHRHCLHMGQWIRSTSCSRWFLLVWDVTWKLFEKWNERSWEILVLFIVLLTFSSSYLQCNRDRGTEQLHKRWRTYESI